MVVMVMKVGGQGGRQSTNRAAVFLLPELAVGGGRKKMKRRGEDKIGGCIYTWGKMI